MRRVIAAAPALLCVGWATLMPTIAHAQSSAPSGQKCIETYLRGESALAGQLLTMNPPAHCDNDLVDSVGRHFNSLTASGKLDPTAANLLALQNGTIPSKYPEGLGLVVMRYRDSGEQKADAQRTLKLLYSDFAQLPVSDSATVDGYKIGLAAGSRPDPDRPLTDVCVAGVNESTNNSGAVICRSMESSDTRALQSKAEQIIRADLPAVRF